MAIEIEAKMAVENLAPLRARLIERGGRLRGRYKETNSFFDTKDASLQASDSGLRVRINRNLETGEEQFIVTFKGPRQPGRLKAREEIELSVVNGADAEKLLAVLGYQRTLVFEKKRESYELEGCKVELDELPLLGNFIEIEGPDEPSVLRVRENLGLGSREIIRSGYASMLARFLRERGTPECEVRF